MKQKFFFLRLYLSAMMVLLVSTSISAQVTIGSLKPPSQFSLLDLDASEQRKALHNARLTTDERDALVTRDCPPNVRNLAKGLLLYNTDTHCLEFWNGTEWISLCAGDILDPCAGFENLHAAFCEYPVPTIADLNARVREAGGRGTVQWFTAATSGNALVPTDELEDNTEYWADNCAGATARIPVRVSLIDCTIAPSPGMVTAFTNVMYDFQTQRLSVVGGSGAISFQWYVGIDGNWQPIAGATSATFTIPADFMYSSYTDVDRGIDGQAMTPALRGHREISFRRVSANPFNSTDDAYLNILFIRTNTSGFGEFNGVRYLTMNRAPYGGVSTGNPDIIQVALLNLGATNDNNLGNLFQWGRRADGHERIDWVKNPATGANIFGAGTSGTVQRSSGSDQLDPNTGQATGSWAGQFIRGVVDLQRNWSYDINDLWGNTYNHFRTVPNNVPRNLSEWTSRGQANNPCPDGWYVPSRFDWTDMHSGNGAADGGFSGVSNINIQYDGINTWLWRLITPSGAVGGIILTNQNGESLFLPAAHTRHGISGDLELGGGPGNFGAYQSSTFYDTSGMHQLVFFQLQYTIMSTAMASLRAAGASVRCVSVENICAPLTSVTLSPSGTVNRFFNADNTPVAGNTVEFTVDVQGGTQTNLTREWFVDDVLQIGQTGTTFTYTVSVPDPGQTAVQSRIHVVVRDHDCTPAHSLSSAQVTVNSARLAPDTEPGTFRLTGRNCFDLAAGNDGNDGCASLAARTNDFTRYPTHTYTFTTVNNLSYSGLQFIVEDPHRLLSGYVTSIPSGSTTNPSTLTLTFNQERVNQEVAGKHRNDALTITIRAIFFNNLNQLREARLDISAQDCICGCAVRANNPSGWLTFMCYNLGAAESVRNMTPLQQSTQTVNRQDNYGYSFQWGRAADGHQNRASNTINVQATSNAPHNNFIIDSYDWRSDDPNGLDRWNIPGNDPCPPGWRVPTRGDWQSVFGVGYGNLAIGPPTFEVGRYINGNHIRYVSVGWQHGATGFLITPTNSNAPTLFLPTVSFRRLEDGQTANLQQGGGHGFYWSSTVGVHPIFPLFAYRLEFSMNSVSTAPSVNSPGSIRANGKSVRCVLAE